MLGAVGYWWTLLVDVVGIGGCYWWMFVDIRGCQWWMILDVVGNVVGDYCWRMLGIDGYWRVLVDIHEYWWMVLTGVGGHW